MGNLKYPASLRCIKLDGKEIISSKCVKYGDKGTPENEANSKRTTLMNEAIKEFKGKCDFMIFEDNRFGAGIATKPEPVYYFYDPNIGRAIMNTSKNYLFIACVYPNMYEYMGKKFTKESYKENDIFNKYPILNEILPLSLKADSENIEKVTKLYEWMRDDLKIKFTNKDSKTLLKTTVGKIKQKIAFNIDTIALNFIETHIFENLNNWKDAQLLKIASGVFTDLKKK